MRHLNYVSVLLASVFEAVEICFEDSVFLDRHDS